MSPIFSKEVDVVILGFCFYLNFNFIKGTSTWFTRVVIEVVIADTLIWGIGNFKG